MAVINKLFLLSMAAIALFQSSCLAGKGGDLHPPEKESVLETDGGKIEVWSSDFKPIRDANLGAALITLEPNGLQLPAYSDSAKVVYIREGSARVGLYYPIGFPTNVRDVEEGDVLVIPHGWVHWFHNIGKGRFTAFAVAETSEGPNPGKYTPFHLTGADKPYGGILHGFHDDVLARAWDISKEDVKKLQEAQEGAGIVKVGKKQSFDFEEEVKKNDAPALADFRYNIDDADVDLDVEDGGSLTILTSAKLPVLEKVALSIARLRLKPGAIFAPNWSPNAHRVVYVTRGKGRVQIGSPEGKNALDLDVKDGDLFVVPRFYPFILIADDSSTEGIDVVTVTDNSTPLLTFLAGKNSIFKAIPFNIRTAAFNIDDALEKKIADARRHDAIILPPRSKGKRTVSSTAKFSKIGMDLLRMRM